MFQPLQKVIWLEADYYEAPIEMVWSDVGGEVCDVCSQNLPVWMNPESGVGNCGNCLLGGNWKKLSKEEPPRHRAELE
jgi:hypothetical protein